MTTTERLMSFCARPIYGSLKPYLDRPLRFSGTLWASNGHILIACPDDPAVEAQDIPEAAQIQSFERQYNDHWDFSPLPPIDDPKACVFCHGKRRGHECHTCPHVLADHCDEVDGCFGYGFLPAADGPTVCEDCEGSGIDRWQSQCIDGSWFAVRYLVQIATLPGVAFSVGTPSEPLQMPASFFRCDGGWGALMPMSPPTKE